MRVAESIRARVDAALKVEALPWSLEDSSREPWYDGHEWIGPDERKRRGINVVVSWQVWNSTGQGIHTSVCGNEWYLPVLELIAHAPTDLALLLVAAEALNGMLAAFDPGDHRHGPDELYPCGKCAYDIAVMAKRDLEADR